MDVCMYIFMYVCMNVGMYESMKVSMYIHYDNINYIISIKILYVYVHILVVLGFEPI